MKKRSKQRLNSTHVLGAVSEMSRFGVVRETIRLTSDEIERQGVEGDFEDWEEFEERYRESEINWQRQSKEQLNRREFKGRMRSRSSIEGAISELVRLGMRRTRYRGPAKTRLAN